MLTYKSYEQTIREQSDQIIGEANNVLHTPIADLVKNAFNKFGQSEFLKKVRKNVSKAKENLSKNIEKSEENLAKNVKKVGKKLGLGGEEKGYTMSPEEASKRLAGELTKAAGLTVPPAAAVTNPELLTTSQKKPAVKIPKQTKTEVEQKPTTNIPKKTTKPEEHTTTPKQSTTGEEQHTTTTTTQTTTGGGTDHNVPSGDQGEHQEHTQGLLHKAWGHISKAAQEHPAAAGALGALAAGAAGLGLKKLISRRRKKQQA